MKTFTPLSVLVLIFCLTTGCADDLQGNFNDSFTLNSQEMVVNAQGILLDANNHNARAQEKNHKISINSRFTLWSDPPPVGSGYQITINGSGTAIRMGKAKLVIQETITTNTQPWTTVADVVITAANGDELHFCYRSTVDGSESPVMVFTGTCKVNGGTGAFKNATGTLEYNGSRSWETGSGSATFSGEIIY